MVQFGHINTEEMTRQSLQYHGIEDIEKIMNVPQPPPPLEVQIQQMKSADLDKDRQLEMMKLQSESRKRESEITLNLAKAKQLGDTEGAAMLEMQLEREKATMDMNSKWMDMLFKREEHQMNMQHKQQEHALDRQVAMQDAALNSQVAQQGAAIDLQVKRATGQQAIQQGDELHQAKLKQMKERQSLQKGPNGKGGGKSGGMA